MRRTRPVQHALPRKCSAGRDQRHGQLRADLTDAATCHHGTGGGLRSSPHLQHTRCRKSRCCAGISNLGMSALESTVFPVCEGRSESSQRV